MEVSASLLNVDESSAISTFYRIEVAHTDYFHIDVMDGEFVTNNTVDLMKQYADNLKNITSIPLDVHLMCKDVKKFVDMFAPCMPRIINFHIEACSGHDEIIDLIKYIKDSGSMVGIAVNPDTDISSIFEYLPYIHNCLVMSVVPGKGGQRFIENSVDKIRTLRSYIDENNLDNEIEVDGGINQDTAIKVSEAGADIVAVGSYLIDSKDYKYTINEIQKMR